ncbi:hypothetical protein MYE70_12265 [Marinobacter alexandrii]|uniref:hypothetical protein n=1 Tax=Marinobacter alexandrii TaxID=2570351 RepID=UPI001108A67D|nr:hypothetical protein [Marinobacter alexandrii]MCK2149833.1 hypothetical protein [Marinobacter alexandrii]
MEDLPEKEWKDYGHDSVKAGLSVVPLLGGALATAFETVFSSPIDKRKKVWLKELASTVDELCEKIEGLSPEKLSQNDLFVSAYLQASNIAIRTHQESKLQALRAAVKNTVLFEKYDESKKLIFIRIIDEMTPLHFKVLDFLSGPEKYIKALDEKQGPNVSTHWGSLGQVWDKTFNDVKSSDPLVDLVISDLHRFGFIYIDQFHKASTHSVTTSTGREFIEFVSDNS